MPAAWPAWLAAHPRVERVYFTGDPAHPDAADHPPPVSARTSTAPWSASKSAAPAGRRFSASWTRLQLIVRATSLGDVHSMMLYPAMSSHREISPKQRERMGIRDNLVRLSVGIEAAEDIIADLEQALG